MSNSRQVSIVQLRLVAEDNLEVLRVKTDYGFLASPPTEGNSDGDAVFSQREVANR